MLIDVKSCTFLGGKIVKKCEICDKSIGWFTNAFTTDTGTKICESCISCVDQTMIMNGVTSAETIAFVMNNRTGNKYLAKIGKESLSDIRENEEQKKQQQNEITLPEEPSNVDISVHDDIPEEIKTIDEEREIRLQQSMDAFDLAERQKIIYFKIHGVSHYDLSKMVNFARKTSLFIPYDGLTASEIKEYSPYEEIFETNLVGLLSDIAFIREPNNKYDSNAIKIIATLNNQDFMLGYVPSEMTDDISDLMELRQNGEIDLRIEYRLTGGKFKIAEEDDYDFSDNPKLKIHTGKINYGFNISLFDNNIK